MKADITSPNANGFDRTRHPISFRRFRKLSVICSVVVSLLSACQQSVPSQMATIRPVTYEDLCQVMPNQFGSMSASEVFQWITSVQGHVLEPLAVDTPNESNDPQVVHVVWKRPNQIELANSVYLRNGTLIRLTLEDIKDGPTFREVIASFGPPESLYRSASAYDNNVAYTIGLQYPKLGISVYSTGIAPSGESFSQGKPILPLSSEMRVQKIECYESGSNQQVLRESFFMADDAISITLQRQMPWPGFEQTFIPYNNP